MKNKRYTNTEQRYAIIIGINDYEESPLNYCVKDAVAIKESLVSRCRFKEENTFLITSSKENSNKAIMSDYISALEEIKKRFNSEEDSIFFYFAGHGSESNQESTLWFHERSYAITSVFESITILNPKRKFFIIDACHSGGNVLTRSKNVNQYIENSSGTMLMYACRLKESAMEHGALQHGLFTAKILEAINDTNNYDEDGFLSFNKIIDVVQKGTMEFSDFNQTPVIENKIEGFYPFGILELSAEDNTQEDLEEDKKEILMNNDIERDIDSGELRIKIGEKILSHVNKDLEEYLEKEIKREEFISTYTSNLYDYDYNNIERLEEKIVTYVEESNLTPLKNLIYSETIKKDFSNNIMGPALKSIAMLQGIPLEQTRYTVNHMSTNIEIRFKNFISNNIDKVSFVTGFIIYQAKWGVVLLSITFLIEWDGESFDEISDVNISSFPVKLTQEGLVKVDSLPNIFELKNAMLLEKWNNQRAAEIAAYDVTFN